MIAFLKRLFSPADTAIEQVRPLWHRVVALSRDKRWYADCAVEDSVMGRFDAITMVLCAVLLRMERDEALTVQAVRLTELFIHDMDGQLRENGVGDVVVGKRMGKLMGALGGRLGAYRDALADGGESALGEAIGRNVTLLAGHEPRPAAQLLRHFADGLAQVDSEALLAGRIDL